jgi:hypothetical protein
VQETSEQKRTLFTWQQHNLYTHDNGFGEKRSQCTRCGQRFRSQPKGVSCPGVRVYNPYASASSLDGRPEKLATVEELATEGLMPADYRDIYACLHTVNGHTFTALYERKKAIPRPPDAAPAPAEAIKASCVQQKPAEERKPRKVRQRTPPGPLSDEQMALVREKRIAPRGRVETMITAFGWGALAGQSGLPVDQVPAATQENLDRLVRAACELVLWLDTEALELGGPGPFWAYMAIAVALKEQGKLKTLVYSEPEGGEPLRIF